MMGTEDRLQEWKERVQAVVNSTAGHVSFMLEAECGPPIEIEADSIKKAASLIKIPILMTAFKQVEAGMLKLSERYSIEEGSRVGGAGVITQMDTEKTTFTLWDLLTLMIVVSDNTATNKLIDIIGIEAVNEFCKEQKLSGTGLKRKMMDFKAADEGLENRTCARDIVTCLRLIGGNCLSNVFTDVSRQQMLKILRGQQLLDKLPFYMDIDTVSIANKTGELPGVEHDCGIISFGGDMVFVAVLVDQLVDNSVGKKAIQEIGKMTEEFLWRIKSF